MAAKHLSWNFNMKWITFLVFQFPNQQQGCQEEIIRLDEYQQVSVMIIVEFHSNVDEIYNFGIQMNILIGFFGIL